MINGVVEKVVMRVIMINMVKVFVFKILVCRLMFKIMSLINFLYDMSVLMVKDFF